MPAPPPRNPPPRTAAAKAALANFYCELCGKGYARMNEWEAHEGSYDHQHKKRLKEMKQMQKDPSAGERARRNEEKSAGLISIKPLKLGLGGGGGTDKNEGAPGAGSLASSGKPGKGFKKAGFKSAFGGGGAVQVPSISIKKELDIDQNVPDQAKVLESDTDEEVELYDPRWPTECPPDCRGRLET